MRAVAEHDDAVGKRHRLGDVVGDEHGGEAVLPPDALQKLVHLGAGQRVERAEGLVEEQHARPADQRARKRHALALAAGEDGGPIVGAVGEADIGERAPAAVSRQPVSRAMPTLPITRCQGSSRASWNSSRTDRLQPGDRRAVDQDLARARRVETGDQPQDRRLAAAGAADDGEELPGRDRRDRALQHRARRRKHLADAARATPAGRAARPRRVACRLRPLVRSRDVDALEIAARLREDGGRWPIGSCGRLRSAS